MFALLGSALLLVSACIAIGGVVDGAFDVLQSVLRGNGLTGAWSCGRLVQVSYKRRA